MLQLIPEGCERLVLMTLHVVLGEGDMPARDKQAAVTSLRAAKAPCCMVMDESGEHGSCIWGASIWSVLLCCSCGSDQLQGCKGTLLHGDGRVR